MNDREIVAAICARLSQRLGRDRYEVWFGVNTELSLRDQTLSVNVPNRFYQDWLRCHFRGELETASAEVCGNSLAVEFCIDPMLAPAPSLATPLADPTECQRTVTSNPSELAGSPDTVASHAALAPAANGPVEVVTEASGTNHASDAARMRRGCLPSFVVGDSNCLAYQAAQIAATKPGTYSPLVIYGPTGTGKTHLLEGILTAARQVRLRGAVVYLTAEQFTTLFLEALHGSGMPNFRRKYRGLELLAIDDLQFFANKKATLIELVHTIDTLLRAGKQLVFAADRSPAGLKSLGAELSARLAGGMACRIEPAEFATRLGIVRNWAGRLKLELPDDVAHYTASHLTTQSRELVGALERLQAMSLAHRTPITLALAERALADLIDQQAGTIKLGDIEKAVCEVFGLEPAGLQSSGKTAIVSHPRMLAMFLARKHTRAALSEIGAYFGRRSHSTVISAQKKVETWMAAGKGLASHERTLNLEETIRRVEERLRAG